MLPFGLGGCVVECIGIVAMSSTPFRRPRELVCQHQRGRNDAQRCMCAKPRGDPPRARCAQRRSRRTHPPRFDALSVRLSVVPPTGVDMLAALAHVATLSTAHHTKHSKAPNSTLTRRVTHATPPQRTHQHAPLVSFSHACISPHLSLIHI